ncbi:MAG TPA: hypothetical protein VFO60_05740 [Candidatus Dormibacteraeota bacterium]|nr:hypothetical protein [Candidatus Dormibacteraeota bacterium]
MRRSRAAAVMDTARHRGAEHASTALAEAGDRAAELAELAADLAGRAQRATTPALRSAASTAAEALVDAAHKVGERAHDAAPHLRDAAGRVATTAGRLAHSGVEAAVAEPEPPVAARPRRRRRLRKLVLLAAAVACVAAVAKKLRARMSPASGPGSEHDHGGWHDGAGGSGAQSSFDAEPDGIPVPPAIEPLEAADEPPAAPDGTAPVSSARSVASSNGHEGAAAAPGQRADGEG